MCGHFESPSHEKTPDLLKAATILFAAKPAPLTKHTTKARLCAFHFQCETIWYNRGILGAYKTRTQECCRIGGKSYVEGEPSHTHCTTLVPT